MDRASHRDLQEGEREVARTDGGGRAAPAVTPFVSPYTPDFDRLRRMLLGQEADRVPLFDFVIAQNVKEAWLGRPIGTPGDEVEFWASAGYDFVVASVNVPFDVRDLGSAGLHRGIRWREEHRGAIASREDLERFPWPDPESLVTSVTRLPAVGAVVSGGDIACDGGTFLDPAFLRRVVFPRYRRVADLCHERSLPLINHSDGDLSLVMEDLIDAGFDGFHPFEPKAMDIVEAKRRWGGRVCIMGNVDVDLLARGSPARVREEVRRKLELLSPGGRYCVGSSNSIAPYVPVDSFRALVQAAWEHGGRASGA